MASWDVAGVPEESLDLFYTHTSEQLDWDVLCLQEAFVKSEGIKSSAQHIIYTPKIQFPGLKMPAIIVHENWAKQSKYMASGSRWVAASVGDMAFVSVHLPHATAKVASTLQETLNELSEFIHTLGTRRVCLGLDGNIKLSGYSDGQIIGESVPAYDDEDSARLQSFYEFLCKHELWLPNTFLSNENEQRWKTRFDWKQVEDCDLERGGTQIDFIAIRRCQPVDDVDVMQEMAFSSDHFPVAAILRLRRDRALSAPHGSIPHTPGTVPGGGL